MLTDEIIYLEMREFIYGDEINFCKRQQLNKTNKWTKVQMWGMQLKTTVDD